MRRSRSVSVAVTSAAALVVGLLSAAAPAQAATTTAAKGIPIVFQHSGKCINVMGASTANNAKVVQYTCVPTATNDKWVAVPKTKDSAGNDLYWIQSVGSGKCLTVLNASTAISAPLIQYTCGLGGNELWGIESQFDQPTARIWGSASGLCVNIPRAATDNNVQLIQYTCQAEPGTANERLILPPTTSGVVAHRPFNTTRTPVAMIQGGASAAGRTAPLWYSWVDKSNAWNVITDFNPDVFDPDPNAPATTGISVGAGNYGFTGTPSLALLNDKRVEVTVHNASDGDVVTTDETAVGTGGIDYLYDVGGTADNNPTAGAYAAGRLALYETVGGALWFNPENAGNTQQPVGGWRNLGGTGLTGTPSIVATGTGAQIFARNTAGHLLTAALSGTTLGDWTDLGGTGFGDPDALPVRGDLSIVFGRAADGTIQYKKQTATGTWPSAWSTVAGLTAAGNPSAVVGSADGKLDVAIRGTDNLIYVAQETASGSGTFGGWNQISDPADPNQVSLSDPTLVGYTVPSGQSFGVVFQNAGTDAGNGPYGIFFPADWTATPPAASVAKSAQAAKVRADLHGKSLGKVKGAAKKLTPSIK